MTTYAHALVNDGRGGQIALPPFITQRELDILTRDFVVCADDLFVVTFPRSGTTWTEQIVHLLRNRGEQGDQRLTDACPWLETLPQRSPSMAEFLAGLQGRRLFTCHLPLPLMPNFSAEKGRYIYVARNPKDVAVSYYHHDCSKGGYTGAWEEHFELFMAGKLHFGSYFDHVLPWWRASQQAKNILFLRYEELQADLAAVVERIADFAAIPLSAALLAKVLTGSRFTTMASHQQTNFTWVPQREGTPTHYRKGTIGDWRNQFSADQSRRFDEVYLAQMRGTGLRFDFGEGLLLP